jgi:GTPase SAR1 family protein
MADEAAKNRKIEEQLAQAMEEHSLVIKLLLLGAGDSGKTTLRKQMRNLFGTGFPQDMREEFAPVILSLLLSGFNDVVEAMEPLKVTMADADAGTAALKTIMAANASKVVELDEATFQVGYLARFTLK